MVRLGREVEGLTYHNQVWRCMCKEICLCVALPEKSSRNSAPLLWVMGLFCHDLILSSYCGLDLQLDDAENALREVEKKCNVKAEASVFNILIDFCCRQGEVRVLTTCFWNVDFHRWLWGCTLCTILCVAMMSGVSRFRLLRWNAAERIGVVYFLIQSFHPRVWALEHGRWGTFHTGNSVLARESVSIR